MRKEIYKNETGNLSITKEAQDLETKLKQTSEYQESTDSMKNSHYHIQAKVININAPTSLHIDTEINNGKNINDNNSQQSNIGKLKKKDLQELMTNEQKTKNNPQERNINSKEAPKDAIQRTSTDYTQEESTATLEITNTPLNPTSISKEEWNEESQNNTQNLDYNTQPMDTLAKTLNEKLTIPQLQPENNVSFTQNQLTGIGMSIENQNTNPAAEISHNKSSEPSDINKHPVFTPQTNLSSSASQSDLLQPTVSEIFNIPDPAKASETDETCYQSWPITTLWESTEIPDGTNNQAILPQEILSDEILTLRHKVIWGCNQNKRESYLKARRKFLTEQAGIYSSISPSTGYDICIKPLLQINNSCYLNVTLQLLLSSQDLIDFLDSKVDYTNPTFSLLQCISDAYKNTDLLSKSNDTYRRLIYQLMESIGMQPGTQNDSEESLLKIISQLEEVHTRNTSVLPSPSTIFEMQITKNITCQNCSQTTRNELEKTITLRMYPSTISLKKETSLLFNPGIDTEGSILCDYCMMGTTRRIKVTNITPNKYVMFVIDKASLIRLGGKLLIPTKWNYEDLNMMRNKNHSNKKNCTLILHASIHHQGANGGQGHYTFTSYDIERSKAQIVNSNNVTDHELAIQNNEILTTDSYIIVYRSEYSTIQTPSQKNRKSLQVPGTKPQTKKIHRAKKQTKAKDQKVITDFYSHTKTNDRTAREEILPQHNFQIMFSNIRSLKANKVALEIQIQKRRPMIIGLVETWIKPQDPPQNTPS